MVERTSIPLTLFSTSDTGFFRASPVSRVAVAKAQGPWLEAISSEVTASAGSTVSVPVRVHNAGELKNMPVVVNLASSAVACAFTPPQTLPIVDGVVQVPLKVRDDMQPRTYGITVAQAWRSDIRIGMPGPCTPLIELKIEPR